MREVSAEEIRSSLQGIFFQHFCGRFLKGQDFNAVHRGPMGQGDNDRGCDLFGSRGTIQFVGHCKACASSGETRRELKEAVLNAASFSSDYEHPPQEIHIFSHLPIYSLSSTDNREDPYKTADWIRILEDELQKKIPAYQNLRPTIIRHHAKSMADKINMEPYAFKLAIRFLRCGPRQFDDLSQEEWFDDDQAREEKEDNKIFQEICDVIKELSYLPENKAKDIYDGLLSKIASYVVNNPIKAYRLSDILRTLSETKFSDRFKQVAVFYLGAVEVEAIPSSLLADVVQAVISLEQETTDFPLSGVRICITRALRGLVYSGLEGETEEAYVHAIDDISQISSYWKKFFADLYLRIATGAIYVSDLLEIKFGKLFNEYVSEYPQGAIAKVSSWILNPIAVERDLTPNTIIELSRTLMKDANDILDVKWIIGGTFRVLSLQEVDESGEEDVFSYWGKFLDDLLSNCLPRRLQETSPYLEYLHLRIKIANMIHNLNINDFLMFEAEFIDKKLRLNYWQSRELQINYVGCLYAFFKSVHEGLQNVEEHDISRLARGLLLPRGDSSKMPDPLKDALFSFPGIKNSWNNKIPTMPNHGRRYTHVLKWLGNYANFSLKQEIIRERVRNDLFKFLIFRPARSIKNVRVYLNQSLFELFKRLYAEGFPMLPVAAANSLRAFVVLSKDKNISMFLPLVSKALESPDYEIMRSAHSLWRILYRLDRYAGEGLMGIISDITQRAKERTHPGEGRPRIFWAYVGAIEIKNSNNVESEFVAELSRMLRFSTSEYSDKLGKSLTRSAIFKSDLIVLLSKWVEHGSLIACTLKEFTRSAEIWNLIGTALLDTKVELKEEECLECSAEYYRLAYMFDSEPGDDSSPLMNYRRVINDPKYGFNLINTVGRLCEGRGVPPSPEDVQKCCDFLKTRYAEEFFYNWERTEVFLRIINNYWHQLAYSEKKTISGLIEKKHWLKEKIKENNHVEKLKKIAEESRQGVKRSSFDVL